jgi:N-acetylglucosaminyldiphosphoundecaprenol N-acetyl-beta-D-mannosaminyltransferase
MLTAANTRIQGAVTNQNAAREIAPKGRVPEPVMDSDLLPRIQPGGALASQMILGVPISLVDLKTAVAAILRWTQNREANYVCERDVHGLMISLRDPAMMDIHRAAGMVAPDGMPVVWLTRWRSKLPVKRVCGADLVDALCNEGQSKGHRHYFYGGKPGVAEAMIGKLKAKYPGLVIAGSHTPPFRPLTAEEDAAAVEAINQSGAQIVWVGLNTPKQEYWMRDHVGRIGGATLIGIGAAFDFHSGAVTRAPVWMQKSGLEWLHRLLSEPRRLWRRYLVMAPVFVFKIIREEISLHLTGKPPQ